MELREQADYIIRKSIEAVLPDAAVIRALEGKTFPVAEVPPLRFL